MKKVLVVGTVVIMGLTSFVVGNFNGYKKGYRASFYNGKILTTEMCKKEMDEKIRSNVGKVGFNYEMDGLEIRYYVNEKGNESKKTKEIKEFIFDEN